MNAREILQEVAKKFASQPRKALTPKEHQHIIVERREFHA